MVSRSDGPQARPWLLRPLVTPSSWPPGWAVPFLAAKGATHSRTYYVEPAGTLLNACQSPPGGTICMFSGGVLLAAPEKTTLMHDSCCPAPPRHVHVHVELRAIARNQCLAWPARYRTPRQKTKANGWLPKPRVETHHESCVRQIRTSRTPRMVIESVHLLLPEGPKPKQKGPGLAN